MSTSKPIEMLEAEHRVILKLVGVMSVLADALEASKPVQAQTLLELVEFMRTFADKCHHGKEEKHLFPALANRGVPMQGCPVGALMHEHEKGRALVDALEQASRAISSRRALRAKSRWSAVFATSRRCIRTTSGRKTICFSRSVARCSLKLIPWTCSGSLTRSKPTSAVRSTTDLKTWPRNFRPMPAHWSRRDTSVLGLDDASLLVTITFPNSSPLGKRLTQF